MWWQKRVPRTNLTEEAKVVFQLHSNAQIVVTFDGFITSVHIFVHNLDKRTNGNFNAEYKEKLRITIAVVKFQTLLSTEGWTLDELIISSSLKQG